MIAALLAFGLTSTLLILAPCPDSLLVMRNTLRSGRRARWVTACGTLSGLLAWVVAAALGLSALLRVSWLRRSAVQRWLERITGLALIGFGLRLATSAR